MRAHQKRSQTRFFAPKRTFLSPACPRLVPVNWHTSGVSKHLPILRETFPDRVYLTPKEVARALHGEGKDTKKRVEAIREKLDAGTLIPGIRKAPGEKRWKVKIVDLAAALDGELLHRPDSVAVATPARSSRFKNPGPRITRLIVERSEKLWRNILEELLDLNAQTNRERLGEHVVDVPDREAEPEIIF